jgi:hypothetical protein
MNAAYRRPSPCRLIPALRKPPCDRLGNRLTAEIAAVSLTLASLAAFRASAPTMPGALSLMSLTLPLLFQDQPTDPLPRRPPRCATRHRLDTRRYIQWEVCHTAAFFEPVHRPRAAKAKWRTRRLKLGPIGAFIPHDMFSNSATGVSKRGATPDMSRPH